MFTISIFQIFNIPQRPRWTLVLRLVPSPFGLSTFSSLYIITTDDIFFYSLLVKSSYLVILAWVAICLTSNLSLRRRWIELLDSLRSGVYYIARLGVDHHRCVESGIWLGGVVFSPRRKTTLWFAAFVISEVGSCLAAAVLRFFLSLLRMHSFNSILRKKQAILSGWLIICYPRLHCMVPYSFPAAWCRSGFSMHFFLLFSFLYFPWFPMTSAVSVAPSFFIHFVSHHCNATTEAKQWMPSNSTWSTLDTPFNPFLILIQPCTQYHIFPPRAYFSMGVHWVVGVVFPFSLDCSCLYIWACACIAQRIVW